MDNAQDHHHHASHCTTRTSTLTVVVPAYNEEDVLQPFYERMYSVLLRINCDATILFVDDGSTDATATLIEALAERDSRVAALFLSRNFGKEIAMAAGLDHSDADITIIIDADLQDPPELIPELIDRWTNGYDVVYAQRLVRSGESAMKRISAYIFYRLMQRLNKVAVPPDTGDYRLLSKRAVAALQALREHHRFMKGLFSWIGFLQTAVYYNRDPRYAGSTKFNYWRLWNFALEGITSFTTIPLRLSTYVGVCAALLAFLYGAWMLMVTLLFGNPVPGYPSLIVVILFLGGMQLTALGILGEYLGRVFNESKRRPLYFVKNTAGQVCEYRSVSQRV